MSIGLKTSPVMKRWQEKSREALSWWPGARGGAGAPELTGISTRDLSESLVKLRQGGRLYAY